VEAVSGASTMTSTVPYSGAVFSLFPVTARKDKAPVAVQAPTINGAGMGSISGGGGLIQTTSGWYHHLVDLSIRVGVQDGPVLS